MPNTITAWNDFNGRTALVTGAASGIGFGIAQAIAERGGRLILTDIERSQLDRSVEQLRSEHPEQPHRGIVMDVSDRDAVAAAAADVRDNDGALHVLVNNAGVAHNSTLTIDAPEETIDWMFAVNVMGVLNCTRAFVPGMLDASHEGRILNTSSIGGFQVRPSPMWHQTLYATTKYAVVALSEGLDIELRPRGIAVSVLAPGSTNTRIGTSDRNRPDRFGGPSTGAQVPEVADMLAQGYPPIIVGRTAAQAMMRGAPYVFATTAKDLELLTARHGRIESAYREWTEIFMQVVKESTS